VEVRLGGRLLATTDRAMKLDETGLPARYYLPPDDVQMDLLRPTTFHTNCPFKGEASYWSLDIDGEIHDGIVWSYETPTAQAMLPSRHDVNTASFLRLWLSTDDPSSPE
jgi:uncharacterized protein (DUF427 family)